MRRTFEVSLDLSKKETEMRNIAAAVLREAGVDVGAYTAKCKALRGQETAAGKRAAGAYASPDESDAESVELRGGTMDPDEVAQLRRENARLQEENQRLRAENAAFREERCPSCAALQDELRRCQGERDRWRGRCKAEERGDSQVAASRTISGGPSGKRKADIIVIDD
jgi:hypothetical protein